MEWMPSPDGINVGQDNATLGVPRDRGCQSVAFAAGGEHILTAQRLNGALAATALAIARTVQWVASWSGASNVSLTTLSTTTLSRGAFPGGRLLSLSRPSTPSAMNRSCQRHTQGLDFPVAAMIACVPRPTGNTYWFVRLRHRGKHRRITLGRSDELAAELARAQARRLLAEVALDGLPKRAVVKATPILSDFVDTYWDDLSRVWKASTTKRNWNAWKTVIAPAFSAMRVADKGVFIDELNEEHVIKWFADLNNRTGPGAANRTLEILKNMLNKAEVWGYRLENTNPCRSVRPNKRRQCERFLSAEELDRFGEVLADLRSSDNLTIRSGCAVITLLLLTGCRYREILTLQWQDVKGNRLLLRDSKTGPRTVWLGSAAREVIDSLPRHPKIAWLFWNYQYRRPISCIQHFWRTILHQADLGRLRIHDLRHTFASHAAMSKETLPMIGRLLGHANYQSTARYAHLDDEHLLDAAQQIGDAVERLMGAPLKSPIESDIS